MTKKLQFLLLLISLIGSKIQSQEWEILPYTLSANEFFKTIYFLDENNGFIGIGDASSTGKLISTTDGGLNWTENSFANCSIITSIYFSDSNNGFITTNNQNVSYKTTDGGINWQSVFCGTNYPGVTYFKDNSTAFYFSSSGNDEHFSKSIDNGTSWILYPTNPPFYNQLQDIHFPNNSGNIGYLINNNKVYKTLNNGTDWTEIYETPSGISDATSIYFINEQLGFRLRQSKLEKTTNGGTVWTDLFDTGGKKMSFINSDLIFILPNQSDGSDNGIYKSINQGLNWELLQFDENPFIEDYFFINENLGYMITLNNIYKITSTTLSVNEYNTKNSIKVYPNPTNGFVNISMKNSIKLKYNLYDIFGKKILENGFTSNARIDINNLSNGIYFLKIENTNFCTKIIKE